MKAISLALLKRITTQKQILQAKVEVPILFGDDVELSFFCGVSRKQMNGNENREPLRIRGSIGFSR